MRSPSPREIALEAHRDYYSDGAYDDDRLSWTLNTFLPEKFHGRVLEIGCGNGALLRLLRDRKVDGMGVDASSSGIEQCRAQGLEAQCLDISSDGLPFSNDSFDLVISLETFEHLMNPHFALQEILRVLKKGAHFVCSVPNPLTGHPYLYPGLFEYSNFRQFLEQSGFAIERVSHWEWAPRETFLPRQLRKVPFLGSRFVAGGFRRLVEKTYLAVGAFPAFCYWLWTFDCVNQKGSASDVLQYQAKCTQPGRGAGI